MTKQELLNKILDLPEDTEIVLAMIYPKPDDGYTMGEDEENNEDSNDDDDEGIVDNGDGTLTQFHPITSLEIEEYLDEDTNTHKKVVFLGALLNSEDDDDDDSPDDESLEDEDKTKSP